MKFFRAVLFIISVFFVSGVFAQSSSELKKRRDKLTNELEQLNKEYNEVASSKKVSLKQLNILKAKINLREEKIRNINSEVRNLNNQISQSNNTVRSLQAQLDQLKKDYAGMVLFAYRNKSGYNKLMFIFAAKDFNQAYRRLKYLQQFGAYRERQAGYIQNTQKELKEKIQELDKDKKQKSDLLADQEKEKATLGKEKNNQLKEITNLSKHQGTLRKQQRDLRNKIDKANKQIQAVVRREIEQARREAEEKARLAAAKAKAENRAGESKAKTIDKSSTTSEVLNATPEAAKLSNDFLGNRGRLPWPVANGQLVHGFGTYKDAEGITIDNLGYEIRTGDGAAVRAVFDGEVINITDVSGTYLVIIRHGEYFTSYQNLRTVVVSKGQKVNTKQTLGTVATDPSSGEAEVIFGLTKGVTSVDPKLWLTPN
ncbi:murein hydrolase activator EnvC family protein [Mucilaginibacter segetis]|uniref:Peptidoglycan DD-metalloendopeptidase family protein n=1 Tax=Mucilaginibacter segetis TaxID=2793071 RepID=A0A934PUS0_9SPHI|nr:peptidoglycan DD-metalloendopeptidase family protein [Mucilaginibacter segetis]MBK0381213.1 peptidoglycan DD-metalloendopeptidase family protein [Mucilaginibacter segetis]